MAIEKQGFLVKESARVTNRTYVDGDKVCGNAVSPPQLTRDAPVTEIEIKILARRNVAPSTPRGKRGRVAPPIAASLRSVRSLAQFFFSLLSAADPGPGKRGEVNF